MCGGKRGGCRMCGGRLTRSGDLAFDESAQAGNIIVDLYMIEHRKKQQQERIANKPKKMWNGIEWYLEDRPINDECGTPPGYWLRSDLHVDAVLQYKLAWEVLAEFPDGHWAYYEDIPSEYGTFTVDKEARCALRQAWDKYYAEQRAKAEAEQKVLIDAELKLREEADVARQAQLAEELEAQKRMYETAPAPTESVMNNDAFTLKYGIHPLDVASYFPYRSSDPEPYATARGFTLEDFWRDYDSASMLGAGRRRRKSLLELNMDGKGFSEDLAYIGIDMSPLSGSGVPHHSWEAWYDRTSAENHAKKVELVKRRVAQRTVKILPYTQRPALLSDTFKVDAGRDIHGQVAGGAMSGGRDLSVRSALRSVFDRASNMLWQRGEYSGVKCGQTFGLGGYDCCDMGEEGRLVNNLYSKLNAMGDDKANALSDAELSSLVDQVLAEGHGKVKPCPKKGKGKGKVKKHLPPSLQSTDPKAEKAMSRMAKAARQVLKKAEKGKLKGGDWFSPSTWTWDSVNPVNWTLEDWSDMGKGVDAAIFGALSDPKVLAAAQAALVAGGTFAIPGVGTVGGKTLAMLLAGAVAAHEYVYPSCEKGKGALGCNEYRKEVDEVIRTASKAYAIVEKADKEAEKVTDWLDTTDMIEPGDIMGSGAYRGAFTRGEPPIGEGREEFYYPSFSGREARGVMAAGGEYTGPPPPGVGVPPVTGLPPALPSRGVAF